MFKCFTGENDVERCDDFIQNQTIIDEVRKIVEDQVSIGDFVGVQIGLL